MQAAAGKGLHRQCKAGSDSLGDSEAGSGRLPPQLPTCEEGGAGSQDSRASKQHERPHENSQSVVPLRRASHQSSTCAPVSPFTTGK